MGLYSCLSLFALVASFVPAACQASPLAIDIGWDLISFGGSQRFQTPCIETTIGTPPQNMKMLLAINLGDFTVVNVTGNTCDPSADQEDVCSWGLYDSDASTTYIPQNNNNINTTRYGDGTVAGELVSVGGRSFENMTVVVTADYYSTFGLGGYSDSEQVDTKYPNIPIQLNKDGDTSITGYSIYFQHLNATAPGRLLFGGVEPNKFTGIIETLQNTFDLSSLSYHNITILLSNMSVSGQATTTPIDNFVNIGVQFAPSLSGLAFPDAVLQQLLSLLDLTEAYNLTIEEFGDISGIRLRYDSAPNDTTIDLQFGGALIQVPFWDMLMPYNETHGFIEFYDPTLYDEAQALMGAGFFSNAYTVFDFTHNQVSIAPLRHEALGEDNITPINATGVARLEGFMQQDDSQHTSSTTGLSSGAKAGIGVGVAIGALLVIGAVIFLVRRRLQKTRTAKFDEARQSAALSSQFGEKSELPAGPENTKDGTLSPLLSQWSPTQHAPLLEMEGSEGLSPIANSNATKTIKRKSLPPQELP